MIYACLVPANTMDTDLVLVLWVAVMLLLLRIRYPAITLPLRLHLLLPHLFSRTTVLVTLYGVKMISFRPLASLACLQVLHCTVPKERHYHPLLVVNR